MADLLVECLAYSLGDPAVDLAVDYPGVDPDAVVVDRHEVEDLDLSGSHVDLDHGRVGAEGEVDIGRVVEGRCFESRLDHRPAAFEEMRLLGYLLPRDRGLRTPRDGEDPVGVDDVLRGRLEHGRRHLPRLVDDALGRHQSGMATDDRPPAAVGAAPERDGLGVAVHDRDVVERDLQLVGDDLSDDRVRSLALWRQARIGDRLALRVHPDQRRLVAGEELHGIPVVAGRRETAQQVVGREADPQVAILLQRLLPTSPDRLVADEFGRAPQQGRVVAPGIGQAERCLVRQLVGCDEVAQADFDRVDAELAGGFFDHPLQHERRLGSPRTSQRIDRHLVGEHLLQLDVDTRYVVVAGEGVDRQVRNDRREEVEVGAEIPDEMAA